jgi:hypothetical protein
MTVQHDTPHTDEEWQFEDVAPADASGHGGGLLQTILSEVTTLRDGAQADRVALSDAFAASFAKIEVELEVLRDQVSSLRATLDASGTVMESALTEMLKAVGADTQADVAAIVERVVAAQSEANVEAIVAALTPQLDALGKAVPSAETAKIAREINKLRRALIGPDPR